jgi:hypothetical protein
MVLAQWQKDWSGMLADRGDLLIKQVVWPLEAKTATLLYPIQ